jgi:hypothetical protein
LLPSKPTDPGPAALGVSDTAHLLCRVMLVNLPRPHHLGEPGSHILMAAGLRVVIRAPPTQNLKPRRAKITENRPERT